VRRIRILEQAAEEAIEAAAWYEQEHSSLAACDLANLTLPALNIPPQQKHPFFGQECAS